MPAPTPAVLTTPCTWEQLQNFVLSIQDVYEGVEVPLSSVATTATSITVTGT